MNSKKNTLLLLFTLFSFIIYSQEVKLTDNISFEINEIEYRKSVRKGLYWTFAPEGYRFLIIDSKFYGKSGKKEKLPLFEMNFETQKEKYKVLPYFDVSSEYVKDYYLKVRKKKSWILYIEIDDDFEKGVLSFRNKDILTISVKEGSKKATFELIEN